MHYESNRNLVKQALTCLILALGFTLGVPKAQIIWQTTATTINGYNSGACTLVDGTIKYKVFPAYLDVEEDVTVGTGGTVTSGNDPNTLEIVATFTLPAGATLIGALLWDGDYVLQGKLLDRGTADSIYEDLVNRNSTPPPRPRDPLIIELTGTNTYRLRVYPVALSHSRHFRLRYQLPPKIGVDGFEMRMQAAIIPLFTPTSNTVTVTLTNGGTTDSVLYVESGIKRVLQLPRTMFPTRASLTASQAAGSSALRILPLDPTRQVVVKTSFGSGSFAGNYLNLYAGVSSDVVKALGQNIEVVIFWKWHNAYTWIQTSPYGDETVTSYVSTAQSQASQILSLYGSLGVPGNKVGLLHDNSKNPPRAFPVGANTDASYTQAMDYLRSVQGSYAEQFARSLKITGSGSGSPLVSIPASKSRFLENMHLVKTLYSPDQGTVRHLIVVSVGPEYANSDVSLNDSLNQIFMDQPTSFSTMKNWGFDQTGLDFWSASSNHTYQGTMVSTTYANVPGFSAMNVILTASNSKNSYDFTIPCTGGLSVSCGSLEFHGKSDASWNDSLKWKAYKSDGTLLGSTTTFPTTIAPIQDTATAVLWAGSTNPFSEKKELPLGPVYGFVDKWANLLATEDVFDGNLAVIYGDSGVPRIANESIYDVIPNYDNTYSSSATNILQASLKNSSAWRIEQSGNGLIYLRIPGLTSGVQVEVELFDLSGKRIASWNLRSETDLLRWNVSGIRSGAYLLKLRVNGMQGIKRIVL